MLGKYISAVLWLILAASMVVGGTYAWFTDADLAGEAVFKAGTVEIQACLKTETDDNGRVDGNWNPGDCTQVKYEIKNIGSKKVRGQGQADRPMV